jgi:hypothetical protein
MLQLSYKTVDEFRPRMRVYGPRRLPAFLPIFKSLNTDEFWREAGGPDARRVNMRRLRTDNDPEADRDKLPGEIKRRPYTLLSNYGVIWDSITPEDFIQYSSERERTLRADARAKLEAERVRIVAKPQQTADDNARLQVITKQVSQLDDTQGGYVRTIYNAMSTRAKGVFYGLAAGDVPLHWELTRTLRQDRAQTFRIKRLEAPRKQGRHELSLEFGDDTDRFALVMERDNSIEWRHFRPMSAETRERLLTQLAEATDAGRLTASDEADIEKWDREHQQITADAQGRAKSASESARLLTLKNNEKKLQEEKRRYEQQGRILVESIKKDLFYSVDKVSAPEFMPSAFGQNMTITVEWLRRGGVALHIGDTLWIWWNKRITRTRRYGVMLPKKARLTIRSDGGKFALAMGRPNYEDFSSLWSAPIVLPSGASGLVAFQADCHPGPLQLDAADGVWRSPVDANYPGVRVEAHLKTLFPPLDIFGFQMPGIYQVRLDYKSGGDHSAELHNIDLLILPDVPAAGPLSWDSEDHKDAAGVSHLVDVQLQRQGGNAMMATCTVRDGLVPGPTIIGPLPPGVFVVDGENFVRESGLPAFDLGGHMVDISMINETTGEETGIIWHGSIDGDVYTDLQSLHADAQPAANNGGAVPPLQPMPNVGSQRIISVLSMEQVAARDVEAAVPANGELPNEHLRVMAHLAGYTPEEYANIPAGRVVGLERVPHVTAGQLPDIKPGDKSQYLEYMRSFVADWCPGWDFGTDEAGLFLRRHSETDRPDLQYDEDAPADSTLRLRRGLRLRQDLTDFASRVIVIGDVDEETGQRIVMEESLPEATDPAFEGVSLLHIGIERTHTVGPLPGIKTKAQALVLAREILDRMGRPPYYSELENVPLRPDVKQNHVLYIKGRAYLVEQVERAHINSGEGEQVMTPTVRLLSDDPQVLQNAG